MRKLIRKFAVVVANAIVQAFLDQMAADVKQRNDALEREVERTRKLREEYANNGGKENG